MFTQNKKSNCFHFGFTVTLFPCTEGLRMISAMRWQFACSEWRVGSSMSGRNPDFQNGDEGQDFGKVWQDDFSRLPVDVEGGLQGRRHLLSMKIKQPLRGKFGSRYPWGKEGRRDRGAVLTWIQTHRCAASCCPVGSGAAFCICLGLLSRSRRVAHRSVSS